MLMLTTDVSCWDSEFTVVMVIDFFSPVTPNLLMRLSEQSVASLQVSSLANVSTVMPPFVTFTGTI
jgi:hypothetical protein